MLTVLHRALSVTALLLLTSVAVAQSYDDFSPFAMGKVAGQLAWMRKSCDGEVTPFAVAIFGKSRLKDPTEFDRGYDEGLELPAHYVAMDGLPAACSVYQLIFGPSGLSELWRRR